MAFSLTLVGGQVGLRGGGYWGISRVVRGIREEGEAEDGWLWLGVNGGEYVGWYG
jgi:hypothetical protein